MRQDQVTSFCEYF